MPRTKTLGLPAMPRVTAHSVTNGGQGRWVPWPIVSANSGSVMWNMPASRPPGLSTRWSTTPRRGSPSGGERSCRRCCPRGASRASIRQRELRSARWSSGVWRASTQGPRGGNDRGFPIAEPACPRRCAGYRENQSRSVATVPSAPVTAPRATTPSSVKQARSFIPIVVSLTKFPGAPMPPAPLMVTVVLARLLLHIVFAGDHWRPCRGFDKRCQPTWTTGRRWGSGSASRRISRVTGATSPTPKNRYRSRCMIGLPSVQSK
jgi:hypothetical protein